MTASDPAQAGEGSVVRAVLAVAGTRIVLLLVGTVTSVLIARELGPSGRGQYAVAVAVAVTVVALAHLSVEQAQIYLVSRGTAAQRLATNAVAIGSGLGFLAIVITLGVGIVVGNPFGESLQAPILLAMVAVPATIVGLYTNGLLALHGRTDLLNRSSLLAGLGQCGLLVGLVATDRLTVLTVVFAWLLNALLPLVVSLPFLQPRRTDLSLALAKQEIATGLRYHGGIASMYLLRRVDVLLLAALTTDAEVGLYALAVGLIELTNVATDAVATVLLRRQTTLDLTQSSLLTARLVGVSTLLAALGVSALAVASPLVIPFVYGAEFNDAVPALLFLAPGVLALAAVRSAHAYLVRLNRPWRVTGLMGTAMALNVGLNLALIPGLGISGAGLASSLTYVLLAASYLFWLVRAARLQPADFAPRLDMRARLLRRS